MCDAAFPCLYTFAQKFRTTAHGSEVTIADITISDVLKSQPKLTRLFHDVDKYSSKQSISLSCCTDTAGF